MTVADRAQALLVELAGDDAVLRDDQLAAIEALAVDHRRVLVVQRTGWGKSAVYWIATRLLRDAGAGPTLVVSPLLALMRDQVAAANRMGIRARTINSTNIDDWDAISAELASDGVDVLLISPERLNNPTFRRDVLPKLAGAVGMLVIDEAHCISDWGHDFRPDYRRIADVIANLGAGVPVLATTATANERVTADVAAQIGSDTVTLRGQLDRESLALRVVTLPSAAERRAWVADELHRTTGSGIVYCLTVNEVEQVAQFLIESGIDAAAYTGSTETAERERIEEDLQANRLRAVVATSALGMGYDKGDLAFVIHLGSPSSPIAYYQQVGRAGRAIDKATATLLPGSEDAAIWSYFDSTAFPAKPVVDRVLTTLAAEGPLSVVALEGAVNMRRTRLQALLKVLDVEGAVSRDERGWSATTTSWTYDQARIDKVAANRQAEQDAMVAYANAATCRMRFLRDALDDHDATDCGRCDNCTGSTAVAPPASTVAAALTHLRSVDVILEPRKQWPRGLPERSGNIAVGLRAEPGRALAFGNDPGWGDAVGAALVDDELTDEIVDGVIAVLRRWKWAQRPTWVTAIPSRRGTLGAALAGRLAQVGKLVRVDALHRVDPTRPSQRSMANSFRQATNVIGAFAATGVPMPEGPGLIVDDTLVSGWTMTAAVEVLRSNGAGPLLPLVVHRHM